MTNEKNYIAYGFDAVTLSDANARVLDRCLDRAVYRIFGVCDKDNVSCLRTLLGLHSVSNFVKNRRVKFLDGLLDTGSATLMPSIVVCSYSYCYLSVCVLLCVYLYVIAALWRIKIYKSLQKMYA